MIERLSRRDRHGETFHRETAVSRYLSRDIEDSIRLTV